MTQRAHIWRPQTHAHEGRSVRLPSTALTAPFLFQRSPIKRISVSHRERDVSQEYIPVKPDPFKVNSERRRSVARCLRVVSAIAASGAPAKQIAVETGIGESEIYELRAGRRNPRLDVWFALMHRRPDLQPIVNRIVSGEATAEEINQLIRGIK